MGLQSSNFGTVVANALLTDLKNRRPLLQVLMDGPASQLVLQEALKGRADGFHHQVTIPLLPTNNLSPTDGYSTASSFPSSVTDPDLSSAYAVPTDYDPTVDINKVIVGTFSLPIMDLWTHSAGNLLHQQAVVNVQERIADKIEASVLADMISSTQYESVASGAGEKWGLDTSSSANFLADCSELAAQFDVLNIPKEDRFLVVPPSVGVLPVKFDSLSSRDFDVPGSRAEATLDKIAGFKIVPSNNIGSTDAVAFSTQRYSLVMPKGVVLDADIQEKDRVRRYTRLYTMFGHGSVSEIVAAADGNSPTVNAQRVGLLAATVS